MTSANTGAMLYQLNYEATHWEPGHFCGFYLSHEGNRWKNKLNYFARRREASNYAILTVSPPIYAIGEKKVVEALNFFQASFLQLHKLAWWAHGEDRAIACLKTIVQVKAQEMSKLVLLSSASLKLCYES